MNIDIKDTLDHYAKTRLCLLKAVKIMIFRRFFFKYFSYFAQNIDCWYTLELSQAVLMRTHNLCFRAKIRKNVYPCKPQFYYIKVGCEGYKLHGRVLMITQRNVNGRVCHLLIMLMLSINCFSFGNRTIKQ